jgi:hypothetical protein
MTTKAYLFDVVQPDTPAIAGTVQRCITRLRALLRTTHAARPHATADQRVAHLDDRMLRDIGVSSDAMPWIVRERLQDSIARLHP